MRRAIKDEEFKDWQGRALSAERVRELNRLPICRWCGQRVNRAEATSREGEQTEDQIRRLLGSATYVQSFGGWVPVDCWMEHSARWGKRYVRYERRNLPGGPAVVERQPMRGIGRAVFLASGRCGAPSTRCEAGHNAGA